MLKMPAQSLQVKSIFEYISTHDDDLHFAVGQIINVIQEEDDEWYSGEYTDDSGIKHQGIFPKNFVEMYQPEDPSLSLISEIKSSSGMNAELKFSELEPSISSTRHQLELNTEAPSVLESEPPQSSQSNTPLSTQSNTPLSPQPITPQSPVQSDAPPAPRSDAPPAPRSDAPPAPRSDAPPAPQLDAPPAPRSDAPPAPQLDAPPAPQSDAPPAPRSDAPPAPQLDAPPAPQSDLPPAPRSDAPPAPQSDLPPAPRSDAPPAPQSDLPPASQTDELLASQADTHSNISPPDPNIQKQTSTQENQTSSASSSPPASQPLKASRSSPKRIPSFEKSASPPVFEKPVSNSLKDRIAAFNKASSPTIPQPFKPGGYNPGNSNIFVKKPFVPAPPSKNAYIPLTVDQPISKVYRREEHLNITKKDFEKTENSERNNFAPEDAVASDLPKTNSLKERIALLQKQQSEQASRLADAILKKEKPTRPSKKNVDTSMQVEASEDGNSITLDPDQSREFTSPRNLEKILRSSSREDSKADMCSPIENKSDIGNLEVPNLTEKNLIASSQNLDAEREVSACQGELDKKVEGENEEEEEEDEEEVDAEIKRKENLIARMAKMSGGMSMHGIFGPPGAMSLTGITIPLNKKTTNASDKTLKGEGLISPNRTGSLSAIPLPGMTQSRPQEADYSESMDCDLSTTTKTDLTELNDKSSYPLEISHASKD